MGRITRFELGRTTLWSVLVKYKLNKLKHSKQTKPREKHNGNSIYCEQKTICLQIWSQHSSISKCWNVFSKYPLDLCKMARISPKYKWSIGNFEFEVINIWFIRQHCQLLVRIKCTCGVERAIVSITERSEKNDLLNYWQYFGF